MKILKKGIYLLIAVMLIVFPAGCDESGPPEESGEPAVTGSEAPVTETELPGGAFDFDAAYAAIAPDTVMLTAGEYEITWAELFYYLCDNIDYINSGIGSFEWSDEAYGGMTFEEAILDSASTQAQSYKAVYYGAALLGASLSEEDYAELEAKYEGDKETAGGEDEYLAMLRKDRHVYSLEMDRYLSETDKLVGSCYKLMFGEDGSKLTDEKVAEYTAEDNYLMAKHILRKKTDEVPAEGEKPKALVETEEILKKLDEYEGEDFGAYFDELMFENSEDSGGLMSFPDGYLFQYGNMVSSFYEGCKALEIGSYSGVIESKHGYHIIYRLPINYDAMPYSYFAEGYYGSLRQVTAANVFNSSVSGWMENLELSKTGEYEALSLEEIFKRV